MTAKKPQSSHEEYTAIVNAYIALRVAYLKAGAAARQKFTGKFPRLFAEEKLP